MSSATNLSRRAFVAGLSATTVCAANHLLHSQAVGSDAIHGVDLAKVTTETFVAQQGTSFHFQRGWFDSLETKLISVKELRRSGKQRPAGRTPFSVLFRGPAGQVLPQETYQVTHEHLGTFTMFVVPVGQPYQGEVHYEAVFA